MDEKLFKLIEMIFVGGALVIVIYLGGFFGPVESLDSIGTPQSRPIDLTEVAKQTTAVATLGLTQFPALNRAATATLSPKPTLTPTSHLQDYQIVAGDTCLAIAERFEVTLESLIALNNLDAECRILAGSTLKIPLAVTASP